MAALAVTRSGNTLIINGSPRKDGKCGTLARLLASRVSFDCACVTDVVPNDESDLVMDLLEQIPVERSQEARLVNIADLDIAPCRGCNSCQKTPGNACVIRDGMDQLMELLESAEELVIVSPVFFAGPPAQLKAVLDRLQPHFYRGTRMLPGPKKRAELYAVGDGGDPHGFGPLETICKSALAVAGFALEPVHPCIGVDKADLPFYVEEELGARSVDERDSTSDEEAARA